MMKILPQLQQIPCFVQSKKTILIQEKLEEYTIPASAKEGDSGEGSSPVAKDGGADESDAAPVGQNDGNTSGGSASAEDMKTGNVNTVGNKKAPAPKKA